MLTKMLSQGLQIINQFPSVVVPQNPARIRTTASPLVCETDEIPWPKELGVTWKSACTRSPMRINNWNPTRIATAFVINVGAFDCKSP